MEEDNKVTRKAPSKLMMGLIFFIFTLLIGAGLAGFVIKKYPTLIGLPKNQDQIQAEVESLIEEVGKLIALPADEKPTVATVSDVEKVKDQPFFKNAQNGDKVLIYTNAKKAILYRPSEKKVVEVGAVNINQQPTKTESPEASPKATVKPTISPTDTPTPAGE